MHDYDSMLAVATVIMNRVNSPIFPNSITDVVYAGGQFEPVWSGRLDTVLERGASELAYTVAQDASASPRLATQSQTATTSSTQEQREGRESTSETTSSSDW